MLDDLVSLLPKRSPYAHKGECGRLGIFAGSVSMLGAAVLVARAALRSGVGLVYLITVEEAVPHVNIHYPEIIVLPIASTDGVMTKKSYGQLLGYMSQYDFDAVAIGPGLGREKSTVALIRDFVLNYCVPEHIRMVLDADGLMALKVDDFRDVKDLLLVVTPHPKEYESFFGEACRGVSDDFRSERALTAAKSLRQVVVLKGHHTVVASGDHTILNDSGNAGMATAGSGDVLTGMIGAFIAQGVSLMDAGILSVYGHGVAGDLAFAEKGDGLIASDIVEQIPKAILSIHV